MKTRIYLSLVLLPALICLGCADRETALLKRMNDSVAAIPIIDSHEHLGPESSRIGRNIGLMSLLPTWEQDQMRENLVGLNPGNGPGRLPSDIDEQWKLAAPYFERIHNTAGQKVLIRACRDLFGIDDFSAETYRDVMEAFNRANRPGRYDEVLRGKAGIELIIADVWNWTGEDIPPYDPTLFRNVVRLDDFIFKQYWRDWEVWKSIDNVQERTGIQIKNLTDWERALEIAFLDSKKRGFVAIKTAIAYMRTLGFDHVERRDAAAAFGRMLKYRGVKGRPLPPDRKLLEDYCFGLIADGCVRHGLPLQIHTGLFADNRRDIRNSNPANLIPFIIRHRETRFVLMHSGYPYGGELLAMAKTLPNVNIDMCWTYLISPTYGARLLDEAIETVPADKLIAFGGDSGLPEIAYGHAVIARETLAKVLADKVIDGYWSETEALEYARAVLHDNAIKIFNLKL
ncbi:amidohydrolase family protein [candidate division KSB1 bacterium]